MVIGGEIERIQSRDGWKVVEKLSEVLAKRSCLVISKNTSSFGCRRLCLDSKNEKLKVPQAEEKIKSFSLASL